MWFSLLSSTPFRLPRGLGFGSAASRLLGFWVRNPQEAWMFVSVSVTCCHLEVPASGWSLVQRSPNKFLSVIVNPRQRRDPSPLRAVAPWKIIIPIIIIKHSIFYLKITINRDYLHVIQEVHVNSNFHCKNCTSCRKGAKYYICVWLACSVAISTSPTNYTGQKNILAHEEKCLFLMCFWTLNSNMFPEFLYQPHLSFHDKGLESSVPGH